MMKSNETCRQGAFISLLALTLSLSSCVSYSGGINPGNVQTTEQTVELAAAGRVEELATKTLHLGAPVSTTYLELKHRGG